MEGGGGEGGERRRGREMGRGRWRGEGKGGWERVEGKGEGWKRMEYGLYKWNANIDMSLGR